MKKMAVSAELSDFFQHLEDWFYKQFSQASHLSWPHIARIGTYFIKKDDDPGQEGYIKKIRSDVVFQSITLILALFSEIENILDFGLKERLKYLWGIVNEYWGESKELFKKRYDNLLG